MTIIRPARVADLAKLRKVGIETFIETFADFNTAENMEFYLRETYNVEALERELKEDGSICFMAWDDHEALGYTRLRRSTEVTDQLGPNAIELQRLYVHPAHHGKRIGRQLMDAALDHSRANGYDWIWLGVWEHNVNAQAFYRKCGFERFGQHIFPMGDDPQIDWLFRKKLQ